ncbi:MAG: prefoldin subunit 5 [Myxococcota bacterium]|jgi:prefoldin subunit 5
MQMKAIMGAGMDPQTLRLMDEIRTLRSRVNELEQALDVADTAAAAAHVQVDASAHVQVDAELEIDVRAGVLEGAGNR